MNKKLIRLTESDLHRIVKESVNKILNESWKGASKRLMKKYGNKFNNEGGFYKPGTDESKEFTHDEIKKLVAILKEKPIEEMWKPYDLIWCKVQRVGANPQDMYSDSNNGIIYLQISKETSHSLVTIGRMPNTNWLDESGYTYMCWK